MEVMKSPIPDLIAEVIRAHGYDLEEVVEIFWHWHLDRAPEMRIRLRPDAQQVTVNINPVSIGRQA